MSRNQTTRRAFRTGFTLVEMLVVVAIIGTLAALILPAVNGAFAHAKNAACQSNLGELAKAMFQHESLKGYYPGYEARIATNSGTPVTVGWLPQMFDYLDRAPAMKAIRQNQAATLWQEPYEFVICPSKNPDFGATLGSSGAILEFPLSYALNCGRQDTIDTSDPSNSDVDNRRTAIGHNHNQLKVQPSRKVSLDDITDGKNQTILMTENLDLANWTDLGEFQQGVIYAASYPTSPNPLQVPVGPPTNALGNTLARPSSYHQGGPNFAYADGHVETFVIDLANPNASYELYAALMTPGNNDSGANSPASPAN